MTSGVYPRAQRGISEREQAVWELVAIGRTDKEIAQQLVISPNTVKAHNARLMRQLDARNRTELALRFHGITLNG